MNCAKLFYLLWSLILLTYILTGCEKCDCPNQENNPYIEDSTDIEKASVIGIWQMQGTTKVWTRVYKLWNSNVET